MESFASSPSVLWFLGLRLVELWLVSGFSFRRFYNHLI